MRKISSVILAVMMLVMSLMAVPASAFSADDISVNVNVYDVSVEVLSETSGVMTAKLSSNNGNTLYGMKTDRVPVEVTVGSATKYKYEFSFRMRANVPTETYKVTVGNNVAATEKTFPYVRLGDKIDFYNTLDTKSADQIAQFFADNAATVPVDLALYNSLTPNHTDVLALVNAEIVDLNLATGVLNTDTDQEKVAKISAVDTLFTATFADLMEIAAIASVEESGWEALATAKLGTTFDNYFYDSEALGVTALAAGDIYENFVSEAAQVSEFTLNAYAKAFDKATLLQIEQTRSFGVLKNAFIYFENKGSITPDMTKIQALIDSGADADLWKDLIDMDNADCATLVSNAETIASGMSVPGTPSGGTVGGSSTPADRPTGGGGGGSIGVGSSEPAKPVAPEPITPVVPAGKFSDIETVEWAKASIEALAEKGIINGRGDGKFYPGDTVTREEFVKTIIGGFGLLNEDAKADFGDVDSTRWSYAFIATANELGIVTGDGASFNPAGRMSRQDMAVVIYRTAEKLGLELSGDAVEFDDADSISDYAVDAVKALTAAGIINGMGDGTFAPEFTVTRAQMAKVIYGLMLYAGVVNNA